MDEKDDFWHVLYRELGLQAPDHFSIAARIGLLAGLGTTFLPRPLQPFMKWPLFLLALLVYVVVIAPLELLGWPIRRLTDK
ncbi:MAG TPA: hypothetical protein VKR79_08145 [Gaiellaceae bacterium]|nr:hypothetical protein [Gaiellaceae bacterium]